MQTACVPNKIEQVQSGKVDINLNLGLLDQLHELCTEYYSNVSFPTKGDHDHAVADCVFTHLESAGTSPADITDFKDKYCMPTSDLSGLTPDQVVQIHAACTALGF